LAEHVIYPGPLLLITHSIICVGADIPIQSLVSEPKPAIYFMQNTLSVSLVSVSTALFLDPSAPHIMRQYILELLYTTEGFSLLYTHGLDFGLDSDSDDFLSSHSHSIYLYRHDCQSLFL
jgi:hypothetical protein